MSYIAVIASFSSSVIVTKLLIGAMVNRNIVAIPNERSNHQKPTPLGGGIAIFSSIIIGIIISGRIDPLLIFSMLIIVAISFADDIKSQPVKRRVAVHAIAVILGMLQLGLDELSILPIMPKFLENLLIFCAWLWFMNLYNFMDGIDGITSSETLLICLGITLFPVIYELKLTAVIIMAAAGGFLLFNWHKAKIFMGDAGSILLGYMVAFLLIKLAINGYIYSAFILPAYYVTDASITILKRIVAKEQIFEAHSKHAFQIAVRSGMSHSQVVIAIMMLNILLIYLALQNNFLSLIIAYILSFFFMVCLKSSFIKGLFQKRVKNGQA